MDNEGGCLDDETINFCLALLRKLHPKSSIHIYNSFFFARLTQSHPKKRGFGYNYSSVRRWTKDVDIFSQDQILIPIHVRNCHWCLVSLVREGKDSQAEEEQSDRIYHVRFFDSTLHLHLAESTDYAQAAMEILNRYLVDEWNDKYSHLKEVSTPHSLPPPLADTP